MAKYTADNGQVHRIRVSAGKEAVSGNTQTASAVNSQIKVKVSKSNREFGIRPRGLRLYRTLTATEGEETVSKNVYSFLPIFQKSVFDGNTFAIEGTVTIDSVVWTILDKVAEDF